MTLQNEIDKKRAEIHADGYSMSIGELLSMYKEGELDVHPEFQRFFRWTDTQKSRLIESILLGIPLPSIFVAQRADGVWDVIDGVQRLSTIFQLLGVLKDEEGKKIPALELQGTKYLPSLSGKKWEPVNKPKALTSAQQLIIKRSKIDIKIILRESSHESKYELFMRLNSAGSQLSDQELRNCLLVMTNKDAYKWIGTLASDSNFQKCIILSERAHEVQYDVELVVRFLAFRKLSEGMLRGISELKEFLDDKALEIAAWTSAQQATEEAVFRATFELLATTTADNSFRKYDHDGKRFTGGFSISAFEVVAMGIGHYLRSGSNAAAKKKFSTRVQQVVEEIWLKPAFVQNSGSGIRASSRIPITIPLGRTLFGP